MAWKNRMIQHCCVVSMCRTYFHKSSLVLNQFCFVPRRKFRSQTSNNMDRWKSRGEKSQRRVREEKGRRKKRKSQKKVDAGVRKGRKVASHFVFPMFWKVSSLKRRVRSHLARREMKNCTPLWREAHFEVKMYKTHQVRSTCWSSAVERMHAVVAQSTFASQKCSNLGPWTTWTWQHPKRSNFARLPQFWTCTTSNTKRFTLPSNMESWVQSWRPRTNAFCDFPLHLCKVLRLPRESDAKSYEVLHLSRKIILANLKIWCSKMIQNATFSGNQRPNLLTSLMNMSLVLRLPRDMHLWSSLQIFLKCPTHAIVFGHARKPTRFAHSWQGAEFCAPATQKPHLNLQKWSGHVAFLKFWFGNLLRAPMACTQLPRMVREWCALYILIWKFASRRNSVHFFDITTSKSAPNLVCFVHFDLKFASRRNSVHFFDIRTSKSAPSLVCFVHFDLEFASRHNGVHFFDIRTSKSAPNLVCFVHFDLEFASHHNSVHFFDITTSKSAPSLVCFDVLCTFWLGICFAPQRRALFRHYNFQKCSEPGVLAHFDLEFASHHNGVQFFISHLARWHRTRQFSEPTFRPSGATNHCKKSSDLWLFYLFAHLHLLSSGSFSSLIFSLLCFSSLLFSSPLLSSPLLSSLLFSSLLFSDSSHLCFPICPYGRNFDF